jgi:hypothetical protein
VTVSKVMSAHMIPGKTSAKSNNGRKSTLAERDRRTLRRTVPKNHRNTAAQVKAELNIHLEDPVYIKTVRLELHNPTSTVGL